MAEHTYKKQKRSDKEEILAIFEQSSTVTKIQKDQLTKLYYSIGEVADMFEVNASLIRFWEKEFKSIKPKKNKKGNRMFTVQDIQTIDRIYYLVKDNGYTLDGARKALKRKVTPSLRPNDKTSNDQEVIQKLEGIRSRLLSMKTSS